MGFWSTVREKFLDPIGAKFNDYNNRFQAFKTRNPRFEKAWSVITHPTLVRVYALVAGITAAPFTGGFSVMFAVEMSVTFVSSLISVIGKGVQLRRLEKLKLQRNLVNTIADKQKEMDAMLAKRGLSNVLIRPKPEPEPHSMVSAPPGKIRAFFRTVRDIGSESLSPAFFMGYATGPVGLTTYAISLMFGVGAISKEFGQRMQAGIEKSKIKQEINEVCGQVGIPKYKSLAELRNTFQERIIEYEATKRTCAEFDKKATEKIIDQEATKEIIDQEATKETIDQEATKEIMSIYMAEKLKVEKTIKLTDIPSDPNIFKSMWHAVRPWGEMYATPDYSIPADIVSYSIPKPDKPKQPSSEPKVIVSKPITPTIKQNKDLTLN